ncbi:MAG: COG3650 family protein [Brevundimonas sp.]|uniref:COG3650 family protein n=1 Tax=Brevundimonas sp. TaxID=1871086 RepID=UPI0039192635
MRAPAILAVLAPFAALTLGACAEGEAPDQPAPAPAAPEAVLGGVTLTEPLRVIGTEPFWAVNINGDGLVYDGVDRPEERAPNAGPQIAGTTASWSGQTDQGRALNVTLIETPCSDGMSDRTYPLTARVQIGEEALNGCAASVDFLMNTDEQGQPRT